MAQTTGQGKGWDEQNRRAIKGVYAVLLALLTAWSGGLEVQVAGQPSPSALLPKLEWMMTVPTNIPNTAWPPELATDGGGNLYLTGGGGVAELDGGGRLLWNATNSDISADKNFGKSFIRVDALGNSYVAGGTHIATSFAAGLDIAAAKYGPQGGELWRRRYHPDAALSDTFVDARLDPAGNLYITATASNGSTNSILTLKYDPSGTLLWTMLYNGPMNNDSATGLAVDSQGNAYVSGSSVGFGTGSDIVTIKYDPTGKKLWAVRYNGPDNVDDLGGACAVDGQGNVYVTGTSFQLGNMTLKYDSQGNQQWVGSYRDFAYGTVSGPLAPDNAGGVYVTAAFPDRSQGITHLLKYDAQGKIAWNLSLFGFHSFVLDQYEDPSQIIVDAAGNALVALETSFLKLDQSGKILWSLCLPGQGLGSNGGLVYNSRIALGPNESVYVARWGTIAKYTQVPVVPPAATILLPLDNTALKYPSGIFINATSTELPAKMEFWDDDTKIAEDSINPFQFSWNSVPGGSHTLTARFTAQSGIVVTSPPVHITIITNVWPSAAITSPANGAYFVEPASITIAAQASDPDGSVSSVSFFAPSLLGQVTTSPYTLSFNNVPAGMYILTAKATDNEGAVGASPPVSITVLPANSPPVIPVPLQNQTALLGTNISWAVLAYGPLPLQYQWQINGKNLVGQTNSTVSLTNVVGPQAGDYTVIVGNQYGRATNSAHLSLFSLGLRFRSVKVTGGGQLQLGLSAPVGSSVALETSTNAVSWTKLQTLTNTNQDFDLNYTLDPLNSQRFYRLSMP
jgi:hypothetical protein